jgi:acyl-CoA synthetase (NDP forming)
VLIAQSGNLALNVTMQRRSLPIAALVTAGNAAVTRIPEMVEAFLQDDRVTAIGLHLESVPEVSELSRVALLALARKVPIVVLKTGTSRLGAQTALGHTSSIATSDVLCDALFARLGMARVRTVEALVETLKLLHVHGGLPGGRITSASCSGGEAALVADLAESHGLELPELPDQARSRLADVLGARVKVQNPLDYHTYIWGDRPALTACFTALLGTDADAHLLVLDLPRTDRCDTGSWDATIAAFTEATATTGARGCVVSSMPEGLPEPLAERFMAAGIAPMQGLADCVAAVAAARDVGRAQASSAGLLPLPAPGRMPGPGVEALDEAAAKKALAAYGVPVPDGVRTTAADAPDAAVRLGFPVVLKALSSELVHKSDVGGVRVGLTSGAEVRRAVVDMARLSDQFLVEQMVEGATVELLVGIQRDPAFGLSMTLGAGGALVELLDDTTTVLLPATEADIRAALASLRIWPALQGYRGAATDVDAVVRAIGCLVAFAGAHADQLLEVEVNPLLALPRGAVAVDAVVRCGS